MSYVNYEEAISALSNVNSTQGDIIAYVQQLSVDAPGSVTVLYSGDISGIPAWKIVATMGSDVRRIDKTLAATVINSSEFKLKVAQAFGLTLQEFQSELDNINSTHPAKTWFSKGGSGPWAIASEMFVNATTGKVKILTLAPDSNSILVQNELKALVAKLQAGSSITEVNGLSRDSLIQVGLSDSNPSSVMTNVLLRSSITQTFITKPTLQSHGEWLNIADSKYASHLNINAIEHKALMDLLEAFPVPRSTAKVLAKFGVIGIVLSFSMVATSASAAELAGDHEGAKNIIKEWALEAAGSTAGQMLGTVFGALALGALAAVGVTFTAPVAGAMVLAAGLIGGIYGADAAEEIYELTKDTDDNGKIDLFDRITNLLYGVNYTIVSPLPVTTDGQRINLDASFSREEIVAAAKSDIAWRYALRELNPFVIPNISYSQHNADGSLDLYNPATGLGAMTDRYLADRAAMLTWKIRFDKGFRDDDDGARIGPKSYIEDWDTNTIQGNWDFVDQSIRLPGNLPLTLAIDGSGLSLSDHQVVFGTNNSDILDGSGDSDSLYGMNGNDKLIGGKGSDYLEGGIGSDTYQFSISDFQSQISTDTILDTDSTGIITVDGLSIPSFVRGANNLWNTASNDWTATVAGSGNTALLTITHMQSGSRIIIKDWTQGELGITLPGYTTTFVENPANPLTANDDIWTPISVADFNARVSFAVAKSKDGNDTLSSDIGDDFIKSGFGSDVVSSGVGDDFIDGGPGNDVISAGNGNDIIIDTGTMVYYKPGSGVNVADSSFLTAINSVSNGYINNIYSAGYSYFTGLYGGTAVDARSLLYGLNVYLSSTAIVNAIYDGSNTTYASGNDVIDAGLGSDLVYSGDGNDAIDGGDGNDLLIGGHDNDVIEGGIGDDLILGDIVYFDTQIQATRYGGVASLPQTANVYANGDLEALSLQAIAGSNANGNDVLSGGAGNDVILGMGGDDNIAGGDGDDILHGDEQIVDRVGGVAGNDEIDGGAGVDAIYGGAGNDKLSGGTGNDVIQGDYLYNPLLASAYGNAQGTDELFGGDGNDTLIGMGGDDVIYGDADNDIIYGDYSTLDLSQHGKDILYGGSGSDTIYGGAGNDLLVGGAGYDTLIGGSGLNTYLYELGDGADVIRSQDTAGSTGSILQFGAGIIMSNVTFHTSASSNYLTIRINNDNEQQVLIENFSISDSSNSPISLIKFGDNTTLTYDQIRALVLQTTPGSDTINGFSTNDVISAGNGDDEINGKDGNDSLYGDNGVDRLDGNNGSDSLYGGAGNDYLDGGNGVDQLFGGDGNDTLDVNGTNNEADSNILDGGPGRDTLSGSDGSDLYVYRRGDGSDLILDSGSVPAAVDTLRFASGISLSDLQFIRTSWNGNYNNLDKNDLVILINGGPDQIRISSFFLSASITNIGIDQIEFESAPGVVLNRAQIEALVSVWGSQNTMSGSTSNDLFIIDDTNDVIVNEVTLTDIDTVQTSVSYNMGSGIENVVMTGAFDISVNGNTRNNTITGNFGNNNINGGDGNDLINGGAGEDIIVTYENSTIYGEDDDDQLDLRGGGFAYGGNGNDWLSIQSNGYGFGGNGDDTFSIFYNYANNTHLDGGNGSDIYEIQIDYTDVSSNTIWIHDSGTNPADIDNLVIARYNTNIPLEQSEIIVIRSPYEAKTWVQIANTRVYLDTDANGNPVLETISIYGGETYNVSDLLVINDAPRLISAYDDVWIPIDQTASFSVNTSKIINESWDYLTFTKSVSTDQGWSVSDDGLITVTPYPWGNAYELQYTINVTATDSSGQFISIPINLIRSKNIQGTSGNDELEASAYYEVYGNDGNDTITAWNSNSRLFGGSGDDTYIFSQGGGGEFSALPFVAELANQGIDTVKANSFYILPENVENLTLTGTLNLNGTGNDLDNIITGNNAINTLIGLKGNDLLNGGSGNDTMLGGEGNDTYVINAAGDAVTENASEGTDTVQSSVSYTLGTNLENLTLTGSSAINATGNAADNILNGNSGANTLSGGGGNDTMAGGGGNDIYVVDSASDVVTEAASAGTDTVQSSVTYSLGSNVENLTLTGSSAINGTGNTLANTITGNGADNTLDGGSGNDTLVGGLGNDLYIVNATGDVVTEAASAGTDTIQSSVTYTLGSNVENLTLTGTSAINATGNTLNNVLIGNIGNNTLSGGTGSDTMSGGAGNDTYVVDVAGDVVTENAGEGTDTVQSAITYTLGSNLENLTLTGTTAINGTGNTQNNTLTGNSGNNTLNGGTGTDTLVGGLGNDIYIIDDSTDVVTEAASAGTDTVQSSITYTLGSNVENLTLTGSAALNGTGNSLNNTLTGNSGNNTLNGGTGTDTMAGGLGNDIYVVDVATDVVTEAASAGTDTVQSAVTYTLGSNVENLTLTGTGANNGTGNTLNNSLTGNSGANTLTGGAGNDILDGGTGTDTMVGGTGNDTFVVNSTGDIVTEAASEGTDTVQSSITYTLAANLENLTLIGTTAINGTGNSANNVLQGNSANNLLTGAAGNDTYVYLLGGGQDTITDTAGTDTLSLGPSILQSDLVFSKVGNDLKITVGSSGGFLTVKEWYTGTTNKVETLLFNDSSTMTSAQIDALVQAMGSFGAPEAMSMGFGAGIGRHSEYYPTVLATA